MNRRPWWRRRIVRSLAVVGILLGLAWAFAIPSRLLQLQARRQLMNGCPHQAMNWLKWAGTLNGSTAELEFLKARTYRVQGEMNLARQHLEAAWRLGYPVEQLEREQVLAMAQSGQLRDTEPQLSKMLTDSRGDIADVCEAFVTGYLRTYRMRQAERILTAWLADSPSQPRSLILRAKMQIELLNWKSAEQDLRRVLDAVPYHAEAADLLAGVLLKQKQPDAALKVLPVAVKAPQTRLSAQLRQVECYRLQGNEEAAGQLLQSILIEFPDSLQAHLELGSVESDAGAYGPAIEQLETARKIAPNSPEVRYALAIALRGAGREAEASEHFEYVAEARKAVAEAMSLRSKVEENPNDASLRCHIGTVLLDHGQTERGLVWIQSALEINPGFVPAHERLATYYEGRAGESEEFSKLAVTHRKRSLTP
ncbi:MAG: tetratricopeptide repeat protein [Planctomycetes bacterium]|nr:tetratricopeptide repeat protein [Planctomycetota bacterium]